MKPEKHLHTDCVTALIIYPCPESRIFLIHFLNIAGLGPIFGAIRGALFGPAAFLWIVLGTIFIGGIHDFFSGFLSMRNNGLTMPAIISKYLGNIVRKFVAILIVITGILVSATFAKGAADLLGNLTNISILVWTTIIFIYFLIATVFPVDKIIGKAYPIWSVTADYGGTNDRIINIKPRIHNSRVYNKRFVFN